MNVNEHEISWDVNPTFLPSIAPNSAHQSDNQTCKIAGLKATHFEHQLPDWSWGHKGRLVPSCWTDEMFKGIQLKIMESTNLDDFGASSLLRILGDSGKCWFM